MDPKADQAKGTGFFGVEDTTGTCGDFQNGIIRSGAIERVEFVPLPAKLHVRIIAIVRLGTSKISHDAAQKSCAGAGVLKIAAVPRRYEFVFDGARVLPAANNPPMRDLMAVAPPVSWSVVK
jgi:hypothetical protein